MDKNFRATATNKILKILGWRQVGDNCMQELRKGSHRQGTIVQMFWVVMVIVWVEYVYCWQRKAKIIEIEFL